MSISPSTALSKAANTKFKTDIALLTTQFKNDIKGWKALLDKTKLTYVEKSVIHLLHTSNLSFEEISVNLNITLMHFYTSRISALKKINDGLKKEEPNFLFPNRKSTSVKLNSNELLLKKNLSNLFYTVIENSGDWGGLLKKLPLKQEKIITFSFIKLLSFEEIAKKENILEGNVPTIVTNAINSLQIAFSRQEREMKAAASTPAPQPSYKEESPRTP